MKKKIMYMLTVLALTVMMTVPSFTARAAGGLALSTPDELLSFDAHVNRESDVTLTVTNNSNVDLQNITLTSSAPSGWNVSFDISSIDVLEAGATQEITAHVTPGDSAMTGDYVCTFTASCSACCLSSKELMGQSGKENGYWFIPGRISEDG